MMISSDPSYRELFVYERANSDGKLWCSLILLVNCSIRELRQSTQLQHILVCVCSDRRLSTSDFSLWGVFNNQVYRTAVHDLIDLQERICAAANNVTPQMLHNTWIEVEYISHVTNGSHVEVY